MEGRGDNFLTLASVIPVARFPLGESKEKGISQLFGYTQFVAVKYQNFGSIMLPYQYFMITIRGRKVKAHRLNKMMSAIFRIRSLQSF